MKVRFTPTAQQQLRDAIRVIHADNPSAAARYRKRVQTVLKRLEKFPNSGRSLPEFPRLPYREVIVAPYRYFFRIDGDTVWIVALWHGARLPKSP